ncbi:MAG: signal peptidase I [Cyanobacteria bacterium]|nr:signal peptidase I [Cyanobacteria bacterium bin.51]
MTAPATDLGPEPAPATGPGGQPNTRRWLGLLLWVLLAVTLRLAVIEPRWIPSGSMLPTLQLNDRILVEKVRPHLPAPLPVGTIVVFRPPDPLLEAGYDPKAALIKRVVAGAGDRIEVHGGELIRNGTPVLETWRQVPIAYELSPLVVPPGHLMVLGDNRNASLDSHLWGPLPADHVIGTAVLRYWPLNQLGPIRFSPLPAVGEAVGLR